MVFAKRLRPRVRSGRIRCTIRIWLKTAKHGSGDKVYLIRFHYLAPGAWDVRTSAASQ